MRVEYEDVLRLVLQFLHENGFKRSFNTLKAESGIQDNFLPSVKFVKVFQFWLSFFLYLLFSLDLCLGILNFTEVTFHLGCLEYIRCENAETHRPILTHQPYI